MQAAGCCSTLAHRQQEHQHWQHLQRSPLGRTLSHRGSFGVTPCRAEPSAALSQPPPAGPARCRQQQWRCRWPQWALLRRSGSRMRRPSALVAAAPAAPQEACRWRSGWTGTGPTRGGATPWGAEVSQLKGGGCLREANDDSSGWRRRCRSCMPGAGLPSSLPLPAVPARITESAHQQLLEVARGRSGRGSLGLLPTLASAMNQARAGSPISCRWSIERAGAGGRALAACAWSPTGAAAARHLAPAAPPPQPDACCSCLEGRSADPAVN